MSGKAGAKRWVIGEVNGELTYLGPSPTGRDRGLYRCSCGREIDVQRGSVRTAALKHGTASCGHARQRRTLVVAGAERVLGDVLRDHGVSRAAYWERVRGGWDAEDAATRPVDPRFWKGRKKDGNEQ